jgi:hypothetical protein
MSIDESAPSEVRPGSRYDVVVVVMDCARAKNFASSGGGPLAKTPAIDALTAGGTAIPRGVAPSNWTLPSHVSLFTGRAPSEHGITSYRLPESLPDRTAQILQRDGYRTFLMTENPQLLQGYGLSSGFDVVRPQNALDKPISRLFGVHRERRSIVYNPTVNLVMGRIPPLLAPISWTTRSQVLRTKSTLTTVGLLDEFDRQLASTPASTPVYAFFNFLDTHEPYRLVRGERPIGLLDRTYLFAPRAQLLMMPGLQDRMRWDVLVRGYLESIEQVDRKIAQLVDILTRHRRFDRTLLVVTADHGQSFGEMGNPYHGTGATDSVTRVPLVVHAPQGIALPKRMDRWVSLTEIHSWVLAASQGRAPFDGHGVPTFQPNSVEAGQIVYSECAPIGDVNRSMRSVGLDQLWNHRLVAAYRGDEKFMLDLVTNGVWKWAGTGDPDHTPADRPSGNSADRIRDEVFGPYARRVGTAGTTGGAGPAEGEIEIDERLRSWGYD